MTKVRLGGYLAGALAPALLATTWPVAAANLNFKPTTAIPPPAGKSIISFDISFVDPTIGLYFLADRTNKSITVIDTATNTLKAQFPANPPFAGATGNNDTSGPDGVLTVKHQEVWAGDAPSTIKVINMFSQQTTHVINTGGVNRTDEMCLDPRHNLVLAANNADNPAFVTFTSTTTYTVLTTIKFPEANAGIEQCQWNPRNGLFYLSIVEVNGGDGFVYVLDPVSRTVVNKFDIPLASCKHPQGLAIGPAPQILLGCNASANANNPTAIINENTGAVIATINQQSGSDEVWFNEGDGLYFLARSASAVATQRLGIIDSATFASNDVFTANKNLPRNAHSVAADPVHNQVYVPIPAGVSTICGSLGGNDAQGCIAVFTAVD
jgi:hypothetical protein